MMPLAASTPASSPGETVEAIIRHRLSLALGGWRGSVETAIPTVAFVVGWTLTKNLAPSLWAAGAAAAILAGIRLLQRQSPQYVFSAVLATGIAAFFALRSGKAEDAFLPGILVNAAYAVGTLASVLTRWPLVGLPRRRGGSRRQDRPVPVAPRPQHGRGLSAG